MIEGIALEVEGDESPEEIAEARLHARAAQDRLARRRHARLNACPHATRYYSMGQRMERLYG